MANIEARIIADSVNPSGVRLTSFILKYPRFIHAEFMTHRCFSRNAASSRAIPMKKMLAAIEDDPATFEYWGGNKPGMQAGEELDGQTQQVCRKIIHHLKVDAMHAVRRLEMHGLHKQNANRYLEPFGHITVLATATDRGLGNFFALRAHPAAQPEFQVLAYRMLARYMKSTPAELNWGDWHLPKFKGADEYMGFASWEIILKIATARCARLSYLTFDNEIDPNKDIELHDSLVANGHWSPFEHVAQANRQNDNCETEALLSNFDHNKAGDSGWLQYRKRFENECRAPNLEEIMASKPASICV